MQAPILITNATAAWKAHTDWTWDRLKVTTHTLRTHFTRTRRSLTHAHIVHAHTHIRTYVHTRTRTHERTNARIQARTRVHAYAHGTRICMQNTSYGCSFCFTHALDGNSNTMSYAYLISSHTRTHRTARTDGRTDAPHRTHRTARTARTARALHCRNGMDLRRCEFETSTLQSKHSSGTKHQLITLSKE